MGRIFNNSENNQNNKSFILSILKGTNLWKVFASSSFVNTIMAKELAEKFSNEKIKLSKKQKKQIKVMLSQTNANNNNREKVEVENERGAIFNNNIPF